MILKILLAMRGGFARCWGNGNSLSVNNEFLAETDATTTSDIVGQLARRRLKVMCCIVSLELCFAPTPTAASALGHNGSLTGNDDNAGKQVVSVCEWVLKRKSCVGWQIPPGFIAVRTIELHPTRATQTLAVMS